MSDEIGIRLHQATEPDYSLAALDVKGSGEYVLLECGGPEHMYLMFRDTGSHRWHVNALTIDKDARTVLVFVTRTDHLWMAKEAAWEHAGDWNTERRIAADEQVQASKERGEY